LKDQIKILTWLLLLIHLTSWALLQVAPAATGFVVFKKECLREETRAMHFVQSDKNVRSNQQLASSGNEQAGEPIPEIKVCPVKLAPPPLAFAVSVYTPFLLPQQFLFRQNPYFYLSTAQEPDPPRFA
jgi:hypothetical protein